MPEWGWPATRTATSAPSRTIGFVAWFGPGRRPGVVPVHVLRAPRRPGRGLGRALLERGARLRRGARVEVRCTLATLDPRAQARYVMAGDGAALADLPPVTSRCR